MNIRDGKIFDEAMLTGVLKPCLVKSIDPLVKKEEVLSETTPIVETKEPVFEPIINEGTPSFIPNYTPPVVEKKIEPVVPNFVSTPVYEEPLVPSTPIIPENVVASTPVYEEPIVSNDTVIPNAPVATVPVYEEQVVNPVIEPVVNQISNIEPISPVIQQVQPQINPIIEQPIITPVIEPVDTALKTELNNDITKEKVDDWFKDLESIKNYVNKVTEENEQLKQLLQDQNNTLHNASTDFTNLVGQNQRLM